jgi:hypothetical protein
MGDLFEPVHRLKQKLPKLAGIAEATPEEGLELAAQADSGMNKAKERAKPARPRSASKKKSRKV